MSAAELVAEMAKAGTPPELLAAIAKELFAGEAARLVIEDRRKKDRERKPRKSEEIHGSPRKSEMSEEIPANPSPFAPPKKAPEPQKITPPISPNPPTKRAYRLSSDWLPEPLTGKAAEMVASWQAGELERELAKFRNYWMGKAGKDAAKLDWQRTWINWLISADERKPRNVQQPSLQRNRPNLTDLHRAATAASRDLEDRGGVGPALPAIGDG